MTRASLHLSSASGARARRPTGPARTGGSTRPARSRSLTGEVQRLQRDVGNAATATLLTQRKDVQLEAARGARWTPALASTLAAQIGPGVISRRIVGLVPALVEGMAPTDWRRFRSLLRSAPTKVHFAMICKALAAHEGMAEIADFAATIRTHDVAWVKENCNVLPEGLDVHGEASSGIAQQFQMSCGATTVQIIRGQADPVYALALRAGGDLNETPNKATNGVAPDITGKGNQKLMQEQAATLRAHHSAPTAIGIDGRGAEIEDTLNEIRGTTGVGYQAVLMGSFAPMPLRLPSLREVSTAIRAVSDHLDADHQVPLWIGNDLGPRHYVVAIRRSNAKIMIHDPAGGYTSWVPTSAFLDAKLEHGWHRFWGYDRPS